MEWFLILSALAASLFTLIDLGWGPALAWLIGGGVAVGSVLYGWWLWRGEAR